MMRYRKMAERISLALMTCSSNAVGAYALLLDSSADKSIRQKETIMAVMLWIVFGLTAGLIGSRLVNRRGKMVLRDILVGTAGGLAGGWLYYFFGPSSLTGINLRSLAAAVIGSLAFLIPYLAFSRK